MTLSRVMRILATSMAILFLPLAVAAGSSVDDYAVVFLNRDPFPAQHPWIANLDGTGAAELAPVQTIGLPKIANGTVVFMSNDYLGQGPGIYTMSAIPGASVTKIPDTENVHVVNFDALDISPDGTQVVWAGPEPGDSFQNHNLYVINIDGTGKVLIRRNTGQHHFMITWAEPARVLLSISAVFNAFSQRIHEINPDGTGLAQLYGAFAQRAHGGGPGGRVALTVTQANPMIAIADHDFSQVDLAPGPVTGYDYFSWHPFDNALIGSKSGSIYRVDPTTGQEVLLLSGGGSNGYLGSDVGLKGSACDFGPGEPIVFVREAGKPVWESVSWESCGGPGTMRILNDGTSAALVSLNGELVASPHDFNPTIEQLEIPVTLFEGENTLQVQLRGAPGSGLTFEFLAAEN
jgi:hypothetical protein